VAGAPESKLMKPAKTVAQEIVALHNDIIGAIRTTMPKAIRIGELLTQEKQRLGHGEWLPWITANLPFTDRTARNYIRLYENKDRLKLENVSDLSAAYRMLSAPKDEIELPDVPGDRVKMMKRLWLKMTQRDQIKFLLWKDDNSAT
jgi:hypothetical protein